MTKEKDFYNLIVTLSDENLRNLSEEGLPLPGINGPYGDTETPVRDTSHWLITYLWCYQNTGRDIYKKIAGRCLDYLLSKGARPYGYSFQFRTSTNKDKCGGLIGQAWAIEALAVAALESRDEGAQKLAREVFNLHPFDRRAALWRRVEVDGKILTIDSTLNHQIWFAATCSLIRDKKINETVRMFLDGLGENMTLLNDGVIYHPIVREYERQTKFSLLKWAIKGFRTSKRNHARVRQGLIYRSYGYHLFNLYALAMLKRAYPDHQFWKTEKFTRAKEVIFTDRFINMAKDNKFGIPYNPIGFEIVLVANTFFDKSKKPQRIIDYWYNLQLKSTYNPKTMMLDRNTGDPITLTARIYELTRT